MSDIAHILGVTPSSLSSARNDDLLDIPSMMTKTNKKLPRAVKLQQLPKDVLDLVVGGNNENNIDLPTAVPAIKIFTKKENKGIASNNTTTTSALGDTVGTGGDTLVKVGNKWISTSKPVRSWKWSSFKSSARNDGLQLYHWVRSNVEYLDYPYARFNVQLDAVTYDSSSNPSDNTSNINEYRALQLHTDPNWGKSETDLLLDLVKRYELRWPVIYDRWLEIFGYDTNTNNSTGNRFQIEDLQHRYYSVAALINQRRITSEAKYEAHSLALQTNAASTALASDVNSVNPISNTVPTTQTTLPEGVTAPPAVTETNSESAESEITKQRKLEALLIETAAARSLATTTPQYQPLIQNIATGTSNKVVFDLNKERQRRNHMEALWNRSKAEELEEIELRKELKQIEVQLRKLKKTGAHIVAAAAAAANNSVNVPTSKNPSRASTPNQFGSGVPKEALVDPATLPTLLDHAFSMSTAGPIAKAGIPYIQSCRLLPPGVGDGLTINPALLSRMDTVLDELGISQCPIPTKRVCDVYDTLRKDILTLLILQKNVILKEGILAATHLRLAKKSGNTHVDDEETLLGIPPPKPPSSSARPSSSVTPTGTGGGKGSRSTKSGKTDGTTKKRSTTTPKAGGSTTTGDMKKDDGVVPGKAGTGTTTSGGKQPRKPAVPGGTKRKRKSDDSGPKAVVSSATPISTGAPTNSAVPTAPTSSSVPVSTTMTIHPSAIASSIVKEIVTTTAKPITSSTTTNLNAGTVSNASPSSASIGIVTATASISTLAITTTPTAGSTADSKSKKRLKKSNT